MNRGLVLAIVGAACAFAAAIVGLGVGLVVLLFRLLDATPSHVCGLAYVKASPIARRLVGTPIEQRGFTGGHSSESNGELSERITFDVSGPLGRAAVLAEGYRSELASRLEVTIGRNGRSQTIYSGAFDCPEMHRASR